MNVLVTSAGTASAINVIKALRLRTDAVRITAVDVDATAPGLYLADDRELVPRCSEPGFIPAVLDLCRRNKVKAVFPIYSREIALFAREKARFIQAGVGLLLPSSETAELCDDKRRMYELADRLGVARPRWLDGRRPRFPAFAKPNVGSGTKGARRVENASDWEGLRAAHPDLLLQELVEGEEATVDCLFGRGGEPLAVSPRLRLEVKAGQSVKARTFRERGLERLCVDLCREVRLIGPCNLQFIRRGREWVFIELNPRYAAGGLPLTVAAGANLPSMALDLMLGASPAPVRPREGVTMLRYWQEIFVEEGRAA